LRWSLPDTGISDTREEFMKKSEALSVLGLAEGASDEEVKAAHRKKVVENHPDRFALDSEAAEQAEEKTKKINEARDVLLSRKWEPEYGYRAPYVNPYGGGASSGWPGQQRPGTSGNPYEDWPFGQGQGQTTWVWTSWDEVAGQGGDPFGFAREPQKTAEELKREAQDSLRNELIVIAAKIVLLALFGVVSSLATGLFLYVIISIVYGLWKRLGGCLIAFFVPIAFLLVPFMMIIAPQAGMATFGLIAACLLCFVFDVNNVWKAVVRYRSIDAS
jgi:hypothetical protein